MHYIHKFGKGVKNLFESLPKSRNISKSENQDSKSESENSAEGTTFENLLRVDPMDSPHEFSFGEVYANDLAKSEIEKDKPKFPIGSIIVREKNLTADAQTSETVIAMVKRESGFSKETDNWEFFVFNGEDLKMTKRETVGSCATCHSNAKQTDWIFKNYLKK